MNRAAFQDPSIDLSRAAYVHPSACLYGDIRIGDGVSIWPYVVMRTESGTTHIGEMTNIQDFVMIHGGGVKIGSYCSITHHCNIHVAEIGDNCLIGINATIMDGAVIGDNCIVAGGAFITEGTVIPPNSIVMGTPGKVRVMRNSFVANRLNAWIYHRNALAYARGDYRAWEGDAFAAERAAAQAAFERQLKDAPGS
ncbi:MAG: gamma carbonic anhydrase family protein [Pseudomonadales bacterium]